MRDLYINGKFLSAPATGVHRVAEELIRALDARLAAEGPDRRRAVLLHPRNILRDLPLTAIPRWRVGARTGPLWEQTELPRAAAGGLLLNLCNLGPTRTRAAATLIHDAQVWDAPSSYSAPFRAWYRAVLPAIGRRHETILTVSRHSRAALARRGVAAEARIAVIPNGVDHVRRTPPDRDAARRYGLAPGRFVLALASAQPHKNIALLTRAFRDPRLAGLTLALVGDAPLGQIDRGAGLTVVALGRVSDAALYGLMGEALVWAAPSRTEGFGLPPLEAMALGAPVIAAPCGAMPEVLGDVALYASPDRPDAWAGAIAGLATAPASRNARSAAGLLRAALFRWDDAVGGLLAAIDGGAEARRGADAQTAPRRAECRAA